MFKTLLSLSLLTFVSTAYGSAWLNPRTFQPDLKEVYKTVDGSSLELQVFYPNSVKPPKLVPGIVLFHGGGFTKGHPSSFYYLCDYLASRGMVAISVQYRLGDKVSCLKDAKSAMRYVYQNAEKFGINPEKIAAGGGSAGGHLAAATATSTIINDEADDLSVSTVPKALVLFNPILGMQQNRLWDKAIWKDFSPYLGAHAEIPPTLCMWGDNDKFISVSSIDEYRQKLETLGVRIEIEVYPGQKHSFFDNSKEWVVATLSRVDVFLESLGFLEGEPTVEAWASKQK